MPYNLLEQRWIPVRRRSGTEDRIAPHEIADPDDPPIALASPRPDFDGALAQMLIGLVQTTMPPESDEAWANRWLDSPSPDDLRRAFEPVAHAFDLDGDGPRFFQDLDPLDHGSLNPPAYLLIDTPTGDNNRDHFVKNRDADVLSLPASAMALLSMQTNAPSGGRGHRTSLRGGGPITTLVLGRTLWETVWLNVLTTTDFPSGGHEDLSDTFPWLVSTNTSDDGEEALPTDVNPLQAFWGMPRRIRLVTSGEGDTCALSGQQAEPIVTGYRTRPGGVNYAGPWEHPLSPYRRSGIEPPRAALGQPARIAYKDWLGYVYAPRAGGKSATGTTFLPARAVRRFHQRAAEYAMDAGFEYLTSHDGPSLWTFGFDTVNMKVRGWQEGTFPLFGDEPETQGAIEEQARYLVEAARSVAFWCKLAVKNGLFGSPEITGRGRVSWDFPHHIKQDQKLFQRSTFSALETDFWDATQPAFFDVLRATREAADGRDRRTELREHWLSRTLQTTALRLFDRAVQTDERARTEPQAVVLARRDLEALRFRNDLRDTLGLPRKPAQPSDA